MSHSYSLKLNHYLSTKIKVTNLLNKIKTSEFYKKLKISEYVMETIENNEIGKENSFKRSATTKDPKTKCESDPRIAIKRS